MSKPNHALDEMCPVCGALGGIYCTIHVTMDGERITFTEPIEDGHGEIFFHEPRILLAHNGKRKVAA